MIYKIKTNKPCNLCKKPIKSGSSYYRYGPNHSYHIVCYEKPITCAICNKTMRRKSANSKTCGSENCKTLYNRRLRTDWQRERGIKVGARPRVGFDRIEREIFNGDETDDDFDEND